MPWTWRYEKADGAVVSGAGLQEAIFANQGDAESWLGENWRELLDSGVDQVSLFDDTASSTARCPSTPRASCRDLPDIYYIAASRRPKKISRIVAPWYASMGDRISEVRRRGNSPR